MAILIALLCGAVAARSRLAASSYPAAISSATWSGARCLAGACRG
ncbi:hypothetical protein AB0M92_32855 [Streptomyces sp. NPDC051582]